MLTRVEPRSSGVRWFSWGTLFLSLLLAPASYAQSCATQPLSCTPIGATGEMLAPTTTPRVVKMAGTIRGLITFKDFLDEAQVAHVEDVLVRCAKEADFQVNNREYPKEGYPSDKECNRVVGLDSRGNPVKRAMEL